MNAAIVEDGISFTYKYFEITVLMLVVFLLHADLYNIYIFLLSEFQIFHYSCPKLLE